MWYFPHNIVTEFAVIFSDHFSGRTPPLFPVYEHLRNVSPDPFLFIHRNRNPSQVDYNISQNFLSVIRKLFL